MVQHWNFVWISVAVLMKEGLRWSNQPYILAVFITIYSFPVGLTVPSPIAPCHSKSFANLHHPFLPTETRGLFFSKGQGWTKASSLESHYSNKHALQRGGTMQMQEHYVHKQCLPKVSTRLGASPFSSRYNCNLSQSSIYFDLMRCTNTRCSNIEDLNLFLLFEINWKKYN